ncbi:MAG: hypothetical protein WD401_01505 [Thermomicrobiaceae bacterium]
MRLNDANRRRSLKRRRKLMPEPRRTSSDTSPAVFEPAQQILSEVPVWRNEADTPAEMSGIQEPLEEAPSAHHS